VRIGHGWEQVVRDEVSFKLGADICCEDGLLGVL